MCVAQDWEDDELVPEGRNDGTRAIPGEGSLLASLDPVTIPEAAEGAGWGGFQIDSEMASALKERNIPIEAATPLQAATMKRILTGAHTLIQSPTGSGKTLSFLVPILSRLKASEKDGIRAIMVLPSRELALQVIARFRIVGATFALHA